MDTTPQSDPSPKLGDSVIRNVKFALLRVAITVPLLLVVLPYVLKKLGPAQYGAWAIFVALAAFTQLSDFGLGGTISKFVADHRSNYDAGKLSELISSAGALYGGIAILLIVVLNLFSSPLLRLFVRGASVEGLRPVFLLVTIGAGMNVLSIGASAVLSGLQRLDLVNIFKIAGAVVEAVLTVVLVGLKLGLLGLAAATLSGALLNIVCLTAAARSFLPGVRFSLGAVRLRSLANITSFSAKMFVTQVAVLAHTQLDKLLLGHYAGSATVASYDIGADVSNKVRQVPQLLLSPVLPAAADLESRSDRAGIWQLYRRSHKYLAALGVPLMILTLALAPRFVSLWLGAGYEIVADGIRVLLVTHFINLSTGPGLTIQVGMGRLRHGLYSALVGLLLNVSLGFLLIPPLHFRGALIATGVSVSVVSVLFHVWFQGDFHDRVWPVLKAAYGKPLGVCLLFGAVLVASNSHLSVTWPLLMAEVTLFLVAYAAFIARTRFFAAYEMTDFERHFRFLRIARGVMRFAE